jgi:hypothetical protein
MSCPVDLHMTLSAAILKGVYSYLGWGAYNNDWGVLCLLPALTWLILWSWSCRYVPPKRRLIFKGLQGVLYPRTTAVRTSNTTQVFRSLLPNSFQFIKSSNHATLYILYNIVKWHCPLKKIICIVNPQTSLDLSFHNYTKFPTDRNCANFIILEQQFPIRNFRTLSFQGHNESSYP